MRLGLASLQGAKQNGIVFGILDAAAEVTSITEQPTQRDQQVWVFDLPDRPQYLDGSAIEQGQRGPVTSNQQVSAQCPETN